MGDFGSHFKGSPLNKSFYPLETCLLYLEFPADPSGFSTLDALVEFARKVALVSKFDSGYCGYAFKHLHMTLRSEAFSAIGKMAMRYIGFDLCNDLIRLRAGARL